MPLLSPAHALLTSPSTPSKFDFPPPGRGSSSGGGGGSSSDLKKSLSVGVNASAFLSPHNLQAPAASPERPSSIAARARTLGDALAGLHNDAAASALQKSDASAAAAAAATAASAPSYHPLASVILSHTAAHAPVLAHASSALANNSNGGTTASTLLAAAYTSLRHTRVLSHSDWRAWNWQAVTAFLESPLAANPAVLADVLTKTPFMARVGEAFISPAGASTNGRLIIGGSSAAGGGGGCVQ